MGRQGPGEWPALAVQVGGALCMGGRVGHRAGRRAVLDAGGVRGRHGVRAVRLQPTHTCTATEITADSGPRHCGRVGAGPVNGLHCAGRQRSSSARMSAALLIFP